MHKSVALPHVIRLPSTIVLSATYPLPALRLPAKPTAGRYLLKLIFARPGLLAVSALSGALWMLPVALLPVAIGQGIEAIGKGDGDAVWQWGLAAAGLGIAQTLAGTVQHFVAFGAWIHGAGVTQRMATEHAVRLGANLRDTTTTGDVVAITTSDINPIGDVFEVLGRAFGSVIAFIVCAAALLTTSPLLGLVALVGVPLAVGGIGPMLKPLEKRQTKQREAKTEVNGQAADIVSGLRILRGVGGEKQFLARFAKSSQRVRAAGVEVGRSEAWLAGAEIALPGLVTVVITWLGAQLAINGTIGVGELITFYGVSVFLVIPVTTATEFAGVLSAALVSARKVCKLLSTERTLTEPENPLPLPDGALDLYDETSGIRAEAGKLTVIDVGADAETVAARMARFTDSATPVLAGGVPVDRVALDELRRRVVFAHNQDIWFSGVLREQVTPAEPSDVDITEALYAADAEDIVDALPNGIDEVIGERGREVSGGQRQRLNLARALATGADVLLLDEPTSAVDAHTEARITERVAKLRRGKTTVVFSQSPLWTHMADEVVSTKALS